MGWGGMGKGWGGMDGWAMDAWGGMDGCWGGGKGGGWGGDKGAGWGGGKGGGVGWKKEKEAEPWVPTATWNMEGLNEALSEALQPFMAEETEWSLDDCVEKIQQKIYKQSKKFAKDERGLERQKATPAKALVEEFVESVMGAISGMCEGKSWFAKADFTAPMLIATIYTFRHGKLFARVLGPKLESLIEEGLFKYREEERVQKAMWEAVEASGVQDAYKKKAITHLLKAFDESFLKAPFGSTTAETPELCLLQDFVKGWMADFAGRSWDVLENGVGAKTPDERVLFVTVLFQNLTDPAVACVPADIAAALEGKLPATPWDFIARCAEEVFVDMNMGATKAAAETAAAAAAAAPAAKKPKTAE